MEALALVSRCNAVTSWQNRRATLAGNCGKGRGEIRWTATVGQDLQERGTHRRVASFAQTSVVCREEAKAKAAKARNSAAGP